jgi:hypothetical protein
MDTKRRVEELASRCAAVVIYYQHTHKTRSDKASAMAEIRGVVSEARKDGLSLGAISSEALSELNARYDPETARRLHADFIGGPDDIRVDLVPA